MPPAFAHTGRLLGQGVPVLNSAHPLAQDLLACYVPASAPGGRIINLASPGQWRSDDSHWRCCRALG